MAIEEAWDALSEALATGRTGCMCLVSPYALALVLADHRKQEQGESTDAE